MLGDAVHPMMPNLGQGGCQAVEDAFILSNLLCDVTNKEQIPGVLQDYYRKRIVRSAIVQGISRLSSDMIISTFSTPWRPQKMDEEGTSQSPEAVPDSSDEEAKQTLTEHLQKLANGVDSTIARLAGSDEIDDQEVAHLLARKRNEIDNMGNQLL